MAPPNTNKAHWGYTDDDGPNKWPEQYKTGPNQSPINILLDGQQADGSTCCAGRPLNVGAKSERRPHLDSAGLELASSETEEDRSCQSPNSSVTTTDSDNSNSSLGDSSGHHHHHHHHRHHHHHHNNHNNHHRKEQQNTRFCVSNRKIFLGYPRYLQTMNLSNTGHGWQVTLPPELADHTLVSGPPLGDREYRLAQLHCHWGEDCDHGSEHLVNGKGYAAEIHFVHWNCTDFRSMEEASKHKHGLAVLAVFVQALEGEQNRNRHLDKICAGLKRVQRPGQSASIQSRLDLKKLFPNNRWLYASYEGSLTTPPLSEVVDWVVFLQPIQASEAQVEQMRQLRCPGGEQGEQLHQLNKNCRPVQPLNGRVVSIWSHH